jgi:HYDIN/CFA65/VesB-like, Ig-like domain/Protein of unknown function (DUF1573)
MIRCAFEVSCKKFQILAGVLPVAALLFLFVPASYAQVISVNPTSLAFGNQQAGVPSHQMTFQVTNISASATTVTVTSLASEFSVAPGKYQNLQPGATATFGVRFTPDLFEAFNSSLMVAATGQNNPVTVSVSGTGTNPLQIVPASVNFGDVYVGTSSQTTQARLTNVGTNTLVITDAYAAPPFVVPALTLTSVKPGHTVNGQLDFMPTQPGAANATLDVYLSGVVSPATIPMSGVGITTGAVTSISPSMLSFSDVPVGSTSAPQEITITNSGTQTITLTSTYITPPWRLSGITEMTTIPPGGTLSGTVDFFGNLSGSFTGTLNIQYDSLPAQAVSLTASTVPASHLGVTTFGLPLLTRNQPYEAFLTAAGGTGTITWALDSGSMLPPGLTLTADGEISGKVPTSVALGDYSFSVQAMDQSAPPQVSVRQLVISVERQTNSNCNHLSYDVYQTTNPLVPITDLGTGTYLGQEGGLYPDGSNTDPPDHDTAGVTLAQGIGPLDGNGNPDPNGVYVLMALGISSTQQEFTQLQLFANAEPIKNSKLVLVNGGVPGVTASAWADANNLNWNFLLNTSLPEANVTANQVTVLWFEDIDSFPTGIFPSDITALQGEYESIAQNVHTYFPNCKLMYFSSPLYSGYSNGISGEDPEPHAYDSGYAMKLAIQDQIDGLPSLNYDPAKGPVLAPWMAWGAYFWANGMLPRSDMLTWDCQDLDSDGIHPSPGVGRPKVADQLLNFFKTDSTASIWFLGSNGGQRARGKPADAATK